MERVVVGVGRTAENSVLDWVIERGHQRALDVTLLSSTDMLSSDPVDQQDVLERARERVEAAIPGCVVHTELSVLSIVGAVLRATESAELLVLGSHHRKVLAGITGLPLHLAGESACPTVIVPRGWAPRPRHHRILVGLGDDRSSADALDAAAREAAGSDSVVEIVHSWFLPNMEPKTPESALHKLHEDHLRGTMAELQLAHPELTVDGLLRVGAAPEVLHDRAQLADLIVLGSHRRGLIAAFVFGATGRRLADEATTPLLIVPPGSTRMPRDASDGGTFASADSTDAARS